MTSVFGKRLSNDNHSGLTRNMLASFLTTLLALSGHAEAVRVQVISLTFEDRGPTSLSSEILVRCARSASAAWHGKWAVAGGVEERRDSSEYS